MSTTRGNGWISSDIPVYWKFFIQSNAEHVLPNSAEVYSVLLTAQMPEMEAGHGRWH